MVKHLLKQVVKQVLGFCLDFTTTILILCNTRMMVMDSVQNASIYGHRDGLRRACAA